MPADKKEAPEAIHIPRNKSSKLAEETPERPALRTQKPRPESQKGLDNMQPLRKHKTQSGVAKLLPSTRSLPLLCCASGVPAPMSQTRKFEDSEPGDGTA